MSFTITISSCSAEKVTARCWLGESRKPEKISSYMFATRSGVRRSPSRSGSSPIASRISRTAFSMRPLSMGSIAALGARRRLRRTPARAIAVGGPPRPLREVAEDGHHLGGVERLPLDQRVGQPVERGPVHPQDLGGLAVRLVDEAPDLGVDPGGHLVGVVGLVAEVAAQEHLAVLLTELLR